jgi:hypothetical protein
MSITPGITRIAARWWHPGFGFTLIFEARAATEPG